MFSKITLLSSAIALVNAQDPADGWMAYAVGEVPSDTDRITKMEMTWKVSENPDSDTDAFFSPWFGMDPEDNLNLIQPVNPWLGNGWAMYTEYFQWSPEDNSNSRQHSVEPGQTLTGSLIYNENDDSYLLNQTILETGVSSHQIVKCQNGKKFKLPYVVYEKLFPCRDYPPDGVVTFTDINIECDGKDCTEDVKWESKVKDANCDMKANIISPTSISITWDTSMASKYDNYTKNELFQLNSHGWAKSFLEKI
jgi:hypothetical protein